MNIAIDGPAGAGKSTVAKLVAKELGSVYVDTGAMYRAMALFMLRRKIDLADEAGVEMAAREADISIRFEGGAQHVILGGEDVTHAIRSEEVGNAASVVSANARVRKILVALQQKMASQTSVVMDGRDIGTVVLPVADLKIYLTASPHVRALRRYLQLQQKDALGDETLESIEADIVSRDERDLTRKNSPLKMAEDAVLIDSSSLSLDEVVTEILSLAEDRKRVGL